MKCSVAEVILADAHPATPFAGGNEADVRQNRRRRFGRAQPAKVTPFAGGNEADVRQNRRRRFWPIN